MELKMIFMLGLGMALGLCMVQCASNGEQILVPAACNYSHKANKLQCNSSGGSAECEANATSSALKFKRFALSEIKALGGSNPTTWYRLYPKREDDSGWWHYKGLSSHNSKMSIHSKAKNSPEDEGILVLNSICWAKLSEVIRSSEKFDTIKTVKFSKSLFGKSYEKVKVIGTVDFV